MKEAKILFLAIFLSAPFIVKGQLAPLYSQYMLNGYVLNPALAGADGSEIVSLVTRQQWLGYDGNPRSTYISYQTRILKRRFLLKNAFLSKDKKTYNAKTKGRTGFGGYLFNDKSGIIGKTGGQASYAYHIALGRSGYQLSFGLAAQFYRLKLDQNKMILKNLNDPFIYEAASNSAFVPDFSAGVFIRNRKYFAGLSTGQLLQSALKFNGSELQNYRPDRLYTVIAGMHAFETSDLDFMPSVMIKTTEKLRAQIDINTMLTFRDKIWTGLSYRSNNDLVMMIGIRYNSIFLGYAFDYPTTSIRNQNWGTHEISLYAKFGTDDRRYKWSERY